MVYLPISQYFVYQPTLPDYLYPYRNIIPLLMGWLIKPTVGGDWITEATRNLLENNTFYYTLKLSYSKTNFHLATIFCLTKYFWEPSYTKLEPYLLNYYFNEFLWNTIFVLFLLPARVCIMAKFHCFIIY